MSICPLCASTRTTPSWLGSVFFDGKEFPYQACGGCESLFCDPMPDAPTLAKIYGTEYAQVQGRDDPKDPGRVIAWLRSATPGTFVDYGCGEGALLTEAKRLGWEAIGVEYSAAVAERTARQTGARVVTDPRRHLGRHLAAPVADVLHIGDVIEHLTDLERQMPEILALLKPGGVLLAQGPLEANPHLWLFALKAARRMRPRRIEMPPTHVILATSRGQRTFFSRFGLAPISYDVSETAWPAPNGLAPSDLLNPRRVALFAIRRLSQAATRVRGAGWGNRYFYIGRR